MDNRSIAKKFKLLGDLLELYGENPFKTKSYHSAYNTIRRIDDDILSWEKADLLELNGVGKAIADKIIELRETGEIAALSRLIAETPPGIMEMLTIKGLGAKRIDYLWKSLGVESAGELLHACEENRLVSLKGFGAKTQEEIAQQLRFHLDGQGKYLYGHIEKDAHILITFIKEKLSEHRHELVGDVARQLPICSGIEILTTAYKSLIIEALMDLSGVSMESYDCYYNGILIKLDSVSEQVYEEQIWLRSASTEFLEASAAEDSNGTFSATAHIPVECRELAQVISLAKQERLSELVTEKDIKGVIHSHSTYSDGIHSLEEMAVAAQNMGYEYLVISDHSKAAFYANGLTEERCLEQFAEIDVLNKKWSDFKIFKGIECDILNDGSLDYDDGFLERFEVVIASIHTNLKMDMAKAHERLLRAIAHPRTQILGHMTGRLLLSRPGYPIDHKLIIDACAAHNVVIELNANPYRLDMDWSWITYAMDKGVCIAINPDAHSISGIKDIRYGVSAARKGLLTKSSCLNTLGLSEFNRWITNA